MKSSRYHEELKSARRKQFKLYLLYILIFMAILASVPILGHFIGNFILISVD